MDLFATRIREVADRCPQAFESPIAERLQGEASRRWDIRLGQSLRLAPRHRPDGRERVLAQAIRDKAQAGELPAAFSIVPGMTGSAS
jgi:hypothetical protein